MLACPTLRRSSPSKLIPAVLASRPDRRTNRRIIVYPNRQGRMVFAPAKGGFRERPHLCAKGSVQNRITAGRILLVRVRTIQEPAVLRRIAQGDRIYPAAVLGSRPEDRLDVRLQADKDSSVLRRHPQDALTSARGDRTRSCARAPKCADPGHHLSVLMERASGRVKSSVHLDTIHLCGWADALCPAPVRL